MAGFTPILAGDVLRQTLADRQQELALALKMVVKRGELHARRRGDLAHRALVGAQAPPTLRWTTPTRGNGSCDCARSKSIPV